MTNATDKLRAMLDERGVEYEADDRQTYTFTYWGDWAFTEPLDAKPHTLGAQCELMCIPATPEQAVAATLGSGTCENIADKWGEFSCSECGFYADFGSDLHRVNVCPECGRKVER